MRQTALSVISDEVGAKTVELRNLVSRYPLGALAASLGTGFLVTRFGTKGLARLASAAWVVKVMEDFSPALKRAGGAVLGAAVTAVAERVKQATPAIAPQVEEMERSVLARIYESENEWRPAGAS